MRLISNLKRAKYLGVAFVLLVAAMPVGPIADWAVGSVSNVYAAGDTVEVDTFAALLAEFDATYESASGAKTVKLNSDIVQTTGSGDYLGVNSGWDVTLDLNGHALTLRGDGARGFQNRGALTITGDGAITNGTVVNGAYGLIDNYGTIVIENGTFIDYGQGDGSSIKNRPGYNASLTINAGTFEGRGVNTGNACIYSDGDLVIKDGVHFTNASNRAYAVIVGSGTAKIGETIGNDGDPVVVNGTHGAFGVNGGTVVINNGIYTATNYYGIWITNDGNISDVTINYGDFTGGSIGKNGLRASVDDGRQDVSNAAITINDGKFTGNGAAAAVALNRSGSAHSWGMAISGGEYSTDPDDSYIVQGKMSYLLSNGDYLVDDMPDVSEIPKRVLVEAGVETEIAGLDKTTIQKYGEFSANNGISFVKENKLTAPRVGVGDAQVKFNIRKSDGTIDSSYDRAIKVHAYTANNIGDMFVAKGDAVDDLVLEFAAHDTYDTLAVRTSDESVATIASNGDGTYTINALENGTVEIQGKVTINSAEQESTDWITLGTIKVYSFEAEDEVTVPVGTVIDLQDGVISQIGNPSAITVELTGDAATLSGTTTTVATAESTLTAVNAGDTTLTFKAGDTVLGTTTVKVYGLQNPEDLVLSLNRVGANLSERVEFSGLNLPSYDIMIDDTSIARVGTMRFGFCNTIFAGSNKNCIGAWGAGDAVATVIYHDSLNGATTERFNVKVSEYSTRDVNGNHDVAQGGEVKFMIAEGYDQNSVSYEDDLGFGIINDANGEYTVSVPDDMAAGEYTLKFKDVIGGKTIATQDVKIRVHEIVTSDNELFVKKDGEAATVTVKEKNDYGDIWESDIVVRDASGNVVRDGLTVTAKRNDQFEIEVEQAGEYTVEFSDRVWAGILQGGFKKIATGMMKVYAIDFEVNDLEYHVNNNDTSERLINAINHYWDENSGGTAAGSVAHLDDGHISSRFRVTAAADGSVQEGDGYNFRIRHGGARANHYTLELSALIDGRVVDTKTVHIYVYNMTHPSQDTYYGEIANGATDYTFSDVTVGDRLNEIIPEQATFSAEVVQGEASAVTVDVDAGTVKITKPGQYVVEYKDIMKNGEVADTYTATFNVYGLSADVQDDILDLNEDEEYEYTIDQSQTYGSVRTTITRRGPTGSPARQVYRAETRYDGTGTEVEQLTFDPTQYGEGEYTIRIENRSVTRRNLPAIVEEATFYVVAMEYDYVVVPQGREVVIESGSRWSIDDAIEFSTGDSNLTVDGNTVTLDTTELPLGMTWVDITHDFDDNQTALLKFVSVLVYKVNPDEETDPEKITKDAVESLIDAIVDVDLSDEAALDKLKEVFGEDWLETMPRFGMAMFAGQEIDTRVSVTDLDESEVEAEMVEAVAALGADHVDYYDVSVLMEMNGIELGKLHKLNDKIAVALAEVTNPATGYLRQYFVLRDHNGVITTLEEGVDFYIEDGVIYVISDEFSTYAVVYKDTLLLKSPDTGDEMVAVETGSATVSLSTAIVVGLAAITVAGAFIFVKRR